MSDVDDQSLSDEKGESAPPEHQPTIDGESDEPRLTTEEMPPVVEWTPKPPNGQTLSIAALSQQSDVPIPDPRPASEVWPPTSGSPMKSDPSGGDPMIDDVIHVGLLDDLLDDLIDDAELSIDTADVPLPAARSWFGPGASPEVWTPPGDILDDESEPDLLESLDESVTADVSGITEPVDLGLPPPDDFINPVDLGLSPSDDFINPVDLPPPLVNLSGSPVDSPPPVDLSGSPVDSPPPLVNLSGSPVDSPPPAVDLSGSPVDSPPPPVDLSESPDGSPSSQVEARRLNRRRSPPPSKNPPPADTAPVSEPPRPDDSPPSSDAADPAPWSPLQPPPGETPSQPHAQQWEDAPHWGAPPKPPPEPPSGYSWYVPARRETVYDGPFYTKTGEIHEHALVTKTPDGQQGAESGDEAPPSETKRFELPGSTPTESEKRRLPWARMALIVAVLVLVGGAVFAVRQALSTPSGPASPAEAADAFFAAVANEDMLGLAELLAPAERDAYLQPIIETMVELDRLEDSGNDFASLVDPELAAGLPFSTEMEIERLTYRMEEVGPQVHYLLTTGGTITGQGYPGSIPEWFNKLIGEETTVDDLYRQIDLAENPIELAFIEEDGSWYVSVLYTVAERLRRDVDDLVPEFNGDRVAVGTTEPNLAVEEMFRSVAKGDLVGALNRLDPVEFKAIYDYREYFEPVLQEAADDFELGIFDSETSWELTRIVTSKNSIRGMTTIGVELLEATAVIEGEGTLDITMRNGCAVGVMKYETGETETTDSCALSGEMAAHLPANTPDWLLNDRAQLNIRVVQRNGRWYVAGGPTAIGSIADQLAAFSRRDWQQRNDDVADFVNSLPLAELGSGLF